MNLTTQGRIRLHWGSSLRFELGLFYDNELQSVAKIASITLEVRATRTGTPVMARTIDSGDIDPALTLENWQSGSAQHVVIPFSAEETAAFNMDGANELSVWIVIRATTTESTEFSLAWGDVIVEQIGMVATGAPEAGDPLYYTKAEIDAWRASLLAGQIGFNALRIYNPTLDQFQLAQPSGAPPATVFTFSDGI